MEKRRKEKKKRRRRKKKTTTHTHTHTPFGDWSITFEMTQSSAGEQNASCAPLSARPPAESRPMSFDWRSGCV